MTVAAVMAMITITTRTAIITRTRIRRDRPCDAARTKVRPIVVIVLTSQKYNLYASRLFRKIQYIHCFVNEPALLRTFSYLYSSFYKYIFLLQAATYPASPPTVALPPTTQILTRTRITLLAGAMVIIITITTWEGVMTVRVR